MAPIHNPQLDFSQRTYIMGVLNVTPDSFSDGGHFDSVDLAVKQALLMQEQGADILDIGGESSRPGSQPLTDEEEINRVIPVLKALSGSIDIPISIDSYKPRVIEAAIESGASIVNDITGLTDSKVREIVVKNQLPVIVMHMQGTPDNMQQNPTYGDVVKEIIDFFQRQTLLIIKEGLNADKIIIDPGIGFGKSLEHNLLIIKRLSEIRKLGFPVLFGASRKSFIGAISGADVSKRLPGTIAANVMAVINGASIIRVHDVAENKQAVLIADCVNKSLPTSLCEREE